MLYFYAMQVIEQFENMKQSLNEESKYKSKLQDILANIAIAISGPY